MNILITGGAGFLGSHLADALLQDNHKVTIIDNLSTGSLDNINRKTIFWYNHLKDDLEMIFKSGKFDYVFHCAAQINLRHSISNPIDDAQTNIMGSLNILQLCKTHNVKKVIFASTGGAIYDPHAPLPWNVLSPTIPQSPYGLSKLTIEKYLQLYHKIYGLNYCILRFSNIFGPRQNSKGEAGVISIFIEAMLKNDPVQIFGDGLQTRDFVYVEDAVKAAIQVGLNESIGIYNVSTNTSLSVLDIVSKLNSKIKHTSQVNFLPPVQGEIKDTKLVCNIPEWKPIDFDIALLKTIEYFQGKT